MQKGVFQDWLRWLANAALLAAIHFDAFRKQPLAYISAARWYLVGKRVRARGRLAPLLSRSPRAYTYWALREHQITQQQAAAEGLPPLVAVVASSDSEQLELTLASLRAEGVEAVIASDPEAAATAIDWSTDPWLLPIQAGDQLAQGAAAAYRAAIEQTMAHAIYADDDAFDRWGRRTAPHFKPDWNSELLSQHDYLTGACLVRCSREDLMMLRDERDWHAALVRRIAQSGGAYHLRRVLHHRRQRPVPPAAAKPLIPGNALPRVSIIVPTRNRLDLLRTCLSGLEATDYPALEVLVVDNDSDDPATLAFLASLDAARARVIRHPGPFNYSAINNRAAREARGDLLCLLNNDIEVTSPGWLATLAAQAVRPEVGAVGAQLLYPDGRIQHAGVVIGVGNAAGHAHRFLRPQEEGYFRRHALPQFVSAVTGACLVVARDKFMAVGGLDEDNFAVAYNDVDLCLRLNQRGWQSLYEPRAVLIHHESVSRGFDRDPVGAARFAGELSALQRIWKTESVVDPFHHPQLSRASEQFVLGR